jgi:UDP-2,3-diacylglucosamine pyrophosphatase LpxH
LFQGECRFRQAKTFVFGTERLSQAMSNSGPAAAPPGTVSAPASALIVISDLHIGAGPLDDFDTPIELEFVAFLGELVRRPEGIELVINGDFLEFVQAEPWLDTALKGVTPDGQLLCFTEAQSLLKLRNIIQCHPNVFRALGWFIAKSQNHVVILPGNHDVDFFWPGVRNELRAKLDEFAGVSAGDRLVFHLGRVYRPAIMPSVWIEHGHQIDVNNSFFLANGERWSEASPPILAGTDGEMRLMACIGTQFLADYINKIDQDYTFVDNVKPFSKFVNMFLVASALFRIGTPVRIAVAAWGILRFLAKTGKRSVSALLADGGQELPSAAAVVLEAWKQLSPEQQFQFIRDLRARGVEIEVPIAVLLEDDSSAEGILDAFADNFDLIEIFPKPNDGLLADEGGPTLGFIVGFVADESGELLKAARAAIDYSGAKTVIMGHTHEPKCHPDSVNYVNTGSWTRYLRIEKGQPEPSSWSLLKAEAIAHFPFKLLYAELNTARPDDLQLKIWRSAS